jgi:hypothetical protein
MTAGMRREAKRLIKRRRWKAESAAKGRKVYAAIRSTSGE